MRAALSLVAQQDGGGFTAVIIPLLLFGAIFYFLLIRPQRRRQQQQRDLLDSLEVGDEVITVGGMFGTIRALDEDSVTVEISPGTTVRMVKSAIARKLVTGEPGHGEGP